MIEYKTKTANSTDILAHLDTCKNLFIPPLDQTVNLEEYSDKIYKNSITFEAWHNKILVGLIATYFNDKQKINSFITNVSVLKKFNGRGIAGELMKACMAYAQKESFKEIQLEVNKNAIEAIHIYEKFGLQKHCIKNQNIIMKYNF
ncbi:GNAT family N-acetyltransferase [Marinifilum sp. RC60d5]|uniref:GNAT family N-acetyltransferase n=1 Tax=Marinifilum sp. RC60d5 TaxID=3458414 RepID=UPI0040360784